MGTPSTVCAEASRNYATTSLERELKGKKKAKQTTIPSERTKTVRQEMIELLEADVLSISELSQTVGLSEKAVVDQLSQIQRAKKLKMKPVECLNCGFVFENRTRTRKPGKCPQCRQTRLTEPLFYL